MQRDRSSGPQRNHRRRRHLCGEHRRDALTAEKEKIMRTWRRTLIGLAAAVTVAAWSPDARAAACGDINNNGSVNSGDAVLLLQVASGTNSGTTLCGGSGVLQCGDMNNDGGITIGDVGILLNHAVGNPTLFFCSGAGPQVAPGTTLSGNITSNRILGQQGQTCCGCDASNTYFVDGTTFVNAGVTRSEEHTS